MRQEDFTQFLPSSDPSSAQLTYTTVQQVIDGSIDEADCAVKPGTIHHLVGAYRTLHAARLKRGTLNLDLSEAWIQFDETESPRQRCPASSKRSASADRRI